MATLYDSCLKALAEYSQACGRRLGAIDHGYDQAIDWIGEHRFRSFCTCVLFFCWPATADAGLFLGLTWPFFMLAFTFTFIFAEIPIIRLPFVILVFWGYAYLILNQVHFRMLLLYWGHLQGSKKGLQNLMRKSLRGRVVEDLEALEIYPPLPRGHVHICTNRVQNRVF